MRIGNTKFYRIGLLIYKVTILTMYEGKPNEHLMLVVTLCNHKPRPIELCRIEGQFEDISEELNKLVDKHKLEKTIAGYARGVMLGYMVDPRDNDEE